MIPKQEPSSWLISSTAPSSLGHLDLLVEGDVWILNSQVNMGEQFFEVHVLYDSA